MGVEWIDYLIADDVVVPESARAAYSEAIVYLPHCYQCNDSARPLPSPTPPRTRLELPEHAFVFASLGPEYKINPLMFDAWMEILSSVPGSVLWLLESDPGASNNLRKEASIRGIDPARLRFSNRVGHHEFLTRLSAADIFLDTFPVCAQTTASDALWAGLPLIALAGRAFASRVSASLLIASGLGELVASSVEDYKRIAIELATAPGRLSAVRQLLATSVRHSPTFDSRLFCGNLERAFEEMWRRQQAGLPPALLRVSSD
jgi:predicted O-linked N-acetylglucosamine transferase (SPINDLY family)